MKAQISFDLVMDADMPFVEGAYRLPDHAWEVVIFSRYDNVSEPLVRIGLRWDSGVTGIHVKWPKSIPLNKDGVLRVLSETLHVSEWEEVHGPDSMQLR